MRKEVRVFFDNDRLYHTYTEIDKKRHGKEVMYHKNGKVDLERSWNDGKLDGDEIEYYENGKLKSKKIWDNGRLVDSIRYK